MGDRRGSRKMAGDWMGRQCPFRMGRKERDPIPPRWALHQMAYHAPERSVGNDPDSRRAGGVFCGISPSNRATIGHYTKMACLIGAFNAGSAFEIDNPPIIASERS